MNATSRLILVRHGTCARLDELLLGRAIDAPLDEHGVIQAKAVADYLAQVKRPVLECSPRRRARETAEYIGERLGLIPRLAPALDEIDFGEWAGRSFAELEGDAHWQAWNANRSDTSTPAGENIAAVRTRVTAHLDELRREHPHASLILVTHAEIIRTLVMSWLGFSPDQYGQVPIGTASVTTVAFESVGAQVQELNMQVAA